MKLERTKNAARNIAFDGIQEMMNMVFPFAIRSVMLHFLGTEYLGLNGLFKSLLMFLNLAELGVGSAMVFSMYKPIAEDDAPPSAPCCVCTEPCIGSSVWRSPRWGFAWCRF